MANNTELRIPPAIIPATTLERVEPFDDSSVDIVSLFGSGFLY